MNIYGDYNNNNFFVQNGHPQPPPQQLPGYAPAPMQREVEILPEHEDDKPAPPKPEKSLEEIASSRRDILSGHVNGSGVPRIGVVGVKSREDIVAEKLEKKENKISSLDKNTVELRKTNDYMMYRESDSLTKSEAMKRAVWVIPVSVVIVIVGSLMITFGVVM